MDDFLDHWNSLPTDQSVTVKIYGEPQNIQDTDHKIAEFIQSNVFKAEIVDDSLQSLVYGEVNTFDIFSLFLNKKAFFMHDRVTMTVPRCIYKYQMAK